MQVSRFVSLGALKHYFNVSNSYVLNKLFLVLFPWRHKPWSRKQSVGPNGQEGWYLPPRDDINSPDMYIPVMSLVTYIFLSALIAGLQGKFQPELFGYTASTALILVLIEILGLKFGCYLLNISNESQLLDLVAYSGYKFVGVIATICIGEIVNGGKGTGGWIGWGVFLYVFLANSLFLVLFIPRTSRSCGTRRSVSLTCYISRCVRCDTCSSQRSETTIGDRCNTARIPGRNETRGRSSCSSTPIRCSSFSCGYFAGLRAGVGENQKNAEVRITM